MGVKMKIEKVILPIIMVGVLAASWHSLLRQVGKENISYSIYLQKAEESVGSGLYAQAIEYYKEAISEKSSVDLYIKIKETYDLFYAEEATYDVRKSYLSDMAAAANNYPETEIFWTTQIQLYLETDNYRSANTVVNKALKNGVVSEQIDDWYKQFRSMVKLNSKLYVKYKTALNGYISVYDGSSWTVIDEEGEEVRQSYALVGMLNNDGKGLYVNAIDARLLDKNETARARFNISIEDAGYYDEESGWLPVRIDGKWQYLDVQGNVISNTYEIAGRFCDGKAAAYNGTDWVLVDKNGKETVLEEVEDIKLDLSGSYLQGNSNIILAKKNGSYHLYDSEWKQIGTLSAEDMDICVGKSNIAYEEDGKWGFVTQSGEIALEPTYERAKSFANDYAAVCDEDGLWGVINTEFETIVEPQYLEVGYFTEKRTCLVAQTEGCYQLLSFVFE